MEELLSYPPKEFEKVVNKRVAISKHSELGHSGPGTSQASACGDTPGSESRPLTPKPVASAGKS